MQPSYREDLAYIHDSGFGQLAVNAANLLIQDLQRSGIHAGTVVDLGCGSGISARSIKDAGYEVFGIDLSQPLIDMAKARVPEAEFHVSSFATVDLPSCVAVTGIGEVFNYAFDTTNSPDVRASLFSRIHAALAPGGTLLFDMAGPARIPSRSPYRTFTEGQDWTVLMEAEFDNARELLTRRITTFRKLGDLYRRDYELHELQLVEPAEVLGALERIGFTVQTFSHYDALPLPTGLTGFLGKKPAESHIAV